MTTQSEQAITKAAPSKTTLGDLLMARKDAMAAIMPKHCTPDRLIKLAQITVSRVPKLGECSGLSILNCVMDCARFGLEPGGPLATAHLVPYWNSKANCMEAQFIIDYKGLIELAMRDERIRSIIARAVYAGEKFVVSFGTDAGITHHPDFAVPMKPENVVAVYAVATLADGSTVFDVMGREEVERIKARSKASNAGPWVTDWVEMAKKTVSRRLCKVLPKSAELRDALDRDADENPEPMRFVENEALVQGEEVPHENPADSLAESLAPKPKKVKADPAPESSSPIQDTIDLWAKHSTLSAKDAERGLAAYLKKVYDTAIEAATDDQLASIRSALSAGGIPFDLYR